MGGYYVPNIQRPGFGYQRRSEDDEDGFASDWGTDDGGGGAAPSSSATLASDVPASGPVPSSMMPSTQAPNPSAGDVDKTTQAFYGLGDSPAPTPDTRPSYWPSQTQPFTPYDQGTPYDETSTLAAAPSVDTGVPPDVGSAAANYPSTVGVPGVNQQPMATPSRVPPQVSSTKPYTPGPEEQKLKEMEKQGPKRSVLGTIAGMAAKFGAGYVNAAGRTRPVPVPTQTARDWALRAPGGGAWDTKLARQQQLAQQEQGEEQRAQTAQQVQAQEEERRAQADYYKQHGVYLEQTATTAAKAEVDRQKQQELQRIIAMGGKTPQIRYFPANNPPKDVAGSSDWYIRTDPGDPGYKIAVRPNPGEQIDDETAELLGIPKGSFVPPNVAAGAARSKVALANAATAASEKEKEDLRRRLADAERVRHDKQIEGLGASREADQAEARQTRLDADKEKRDVAINSARDTKLTSAKVWAQNERDKKVAAGGIVSAADEATIAREWLRRSQSAYDEWSGAIRNRGGSAADFTVDPNGSVVQSTEAYGRGGKPVPIGSAPTAAPAVPAAPPAQPTGGRGGRGGGNVPPPVNTAAAGGQPPLPPPDAVKKMKTGIATGFGNGQMWRKEADGSLTYLGQKKNN